MQTLSSKESKAFVKRLKQLKKDLALETMTAFADITGINRQTLNDWFSGNRKPTPEMVAKLDDNLWRELNDMDIYAVAIRTFVANPDEQRVLHRTGMAWVK